MHINAAHGWQRKCNISYFLVTYWQKTATEALQFRSGICPYLIIVVSSAPYCNSSHSLYSFYIRSNLCMFIYNLWGYDNNNNNNDNENKLDWRLPWMRCLQHCACLIRFAIFFNWETYKSRLSWARCNRKRSHWHIHQLTFSTKLVISQNKTNFHVLN